MTAARLTTVSGASWDDPGAALIEHLLTGDEREPFSVARLEAPHVYVQAAPEGERWWVEYRNGGPSRHYSTTEPVAREVARDLITGWIDQRAGWQEGAAWQQLHLAPFDDGETATVYWKWEVEDDGQPHGPVWIHVTKTGASRVIRTVEWPIWVSREEARGFARQHGCMFVADE